VNVDEYANPVTYAKLAGLPIGSAAARRVRVVITAEDAVPPSGTGEGLMTTTTLITGSNKGLGYETARQLAAADHAVYIGARDPEGGRRAVCPPRCARRRIRRGGGQDDRGRRRAGRPGQ
jgi:hypothetical protein